MCQTLYTSFKNARIVVLHIETRTWLTCIRNADIIVVYMEHGHNNCVYMKCGYCRSIGIRIVVATCTNKLLCNGCQHNQFVLTRSKRVISYSTSCLYRLHECSEATHACDDETLSPTHLCGQVFHYKPLYSCCGHIVQFHDQIPNIKNIK